MEEEKEDLFSTPENLLGEQGLHLMRILDIILASIGLVVLSPILLLLSVLIKLDSPGPIFYRARRIGQNGQPFYLYKFRSMIVDADRLGPGITTAADQRVTRTGRILRRYKLDELPQLFNVLLGEMSLVGPRPEDPRYVALYTAEQSKILMVKPGITGIAALTYRHEEEILQGPDWEHTYLQRVMPDKLALELAYSRHRTFWSDLGIIFKTVQAIVS